MKRHSYILFSIFILFICSIGCVSKKISYIVFCDYDKKKDVTTYGKLPLGSVNIPGEWKQTIYNESSRQQYFVNEDSVTVGIAIVPANGFEFNLDNSKKGFGFTKSYYKWDSRFLADKYDLQVDILEEDSVKNYILWTIHGNINGKPIQNYLLFGESEGVVRNYLIGKTDKWNETQIISFLKSLYWDY